MRTHFVDDIVLYDITMTLYVFMRRVQNVLNRIKKKRNKTIKLQ